MAFTRTWDNTAPLGTAKAYTIDDLLRNMKVDIDERLAEMAGIASINGVATIVDGSTVKSLTALTTAVANLASINSTTGRIPRKSGAGTLGDSSITDTGTAATSTGTHTVAGTFTASAAVVLPFFPHCRLRFTASQVVAAGAPVLSDAETQDDDGMNSGGRITVPAGMGGTYLFMGHVVRAASGSASSFVWAVNGTELTSYPNVASSSASTAVILFVRELAAGDYVELWNATAGASITLSGNTGASYFQAVRVA